MALTATTQIVREILYLQFLPSRVTQSNFPQISLNITNNITNLQISLNIANLQISLNITNFSEYYKFTNFSEYYKFL